MNCRRQAVAGMVAGTLLVPLLAAPASAESPNVGRVRVCGISMCIGNERWIMRAATVYGSLGDPLPAIQMAAAAGANTIRVTDFLSFGATAAEAVTSESAWAQVDNVIALAAGADMHVLLDLSPLRDRLLVEGSNPYVQDWSAYLTLAATRINTVTGVAYRDDPTIALVSIAGEPEPPHGGSKPTLPSTSQLTRFFRTTLRMWALLAPETLVNSGGLLHTDWDSGVDWKAIFALPDNDVCAIHMYNQQGLERGLIPVADYCRKIGKPWIMEETGIPWQRGDRARANWFRAVLRASWHNGAAGVGVWNIGGDTVGPGGTTYDINPLQPRSWYAVQHGFAGRPRGA